MPEQKRPSATWFDYGEVLNFAWQLARASRKSVVGALFVMGRLFRFEVTPDGRFDDDRQNQNPGGKTG